MDTYYNNDLFKYVEDNDIERLKLFLNSTESIIVDNLCDQDSCYCDFFIPENPLCIAIEKEKYDIVELFLQSKFPISWKDGGEIIIKGVRFPKILNLLINDVRLLPNDNKELVDMLSITWSNCRDLNVIKTLLTVPKVKDLPYYFIKEWRNSDNSNDIELAEIFEKYYNKN